MAETIIVAVMMVSVSTLCVMRVEAENPSESFFTAPDSEVTSNDGNSPILPSDRSNASAYGQGFPSLEEALKWSGGLPMDEVTSVPPIMPNSTVTIGSIGSLCVERLPDAFVWHTAFGDFSSPFETPDRVGLRDCEGQVLINQSFFAVEFGGQLLLPTSQSASVVSDSILEVLSEFRDINISATVQTTYSFFNDRSPKIAAEVTGINATINDWRLVWLIESPLQYLRSDNYHKAITLSSFPKDLLLLNGEPHAELGFSIDQEEWRSFLVLDWSDAGDGEPSFKSLTHLNETTRRCICVAFAHERRLVDPTVLSSGLDYKYSTSCAIQRKTFWYGGYYWAFYDEYSAGIVYKVSADGKTWSAKRSVGTGVVLHWSYSSGYSDIGFALDQHDDLVALGWIDSTGNSLYLKYGWLLETGTVDWQNSILVTTISLSPYGFDDSYFSPVTVAIAQDYASALDYRFWIATQTDTYVAEQTTEVFCSYFFDGATQFKSCLQFKPDSVLNAVQLLSLPGGRIALVALDEGRVTWKYWYGTFNGWGPARSEVLNIGSPEEIIWEAASAVAASDGTIRVAYQDCFNWSIYVATLSPDPQTPVNPTFVVHTYWSRALSPTIASDLNGDLHLFWVEYDDINHCHIVYSRKLRDGEAWSAPLSPFGIGSLIYGLTSLAHPFGAATVMWTEGASPYSIKWGTLPLPFGTPASTADPWNREGTSPFDAYSSSAGTSVSPATGQLVSTQQIVSIPGRGLNVELSIMHASPRYFVGDQPYLYNLCPYANLGSAWQLNLPWIDDTFVYLGDGQRFLLQFHVDESVPGKSTFENHYGTSFLLVKMTSTSPGYYLFMPSGLTYKFNLGSKNLEWMCDSNGYDPDNPQTKGLNYVDFVFDPSGEFLEGLREPITISVNPLIYRTTNLAYVNGKLDRITRPDQSYVTFSYDPTYTNRLTDVGEFDAEGNLLRTTQYIYAGDWTISAANYPTGSYVVHIGSFVPLWSDVTTYRMTTDMTYYLQTNQWFLSKRTLFSPLYLDGRIVSCFTSTYDGAGALVGKTNYIYRGPSMSSVVDVRNPADLLLKRTVQWFDDRGYPSRLETFYDESSVIPNTCEEYFYDDWGNLINSKDANGHERYASFANTEYQNSFYGPGRLTQAVYGEVYYDTFEDRSLYGWTLQGGASPNSCGIDLTHDAQRAPTLALSMAAGAPTNPSASYSFGDRTSRTVIDALLSVSSSSTDICLFYVRQDATTRALFFLRSDGYFCWWDGVDHPVTRWTYDQWYRIRFDVRPTEGKYTIKIDHGPDVQANLINGLGPINSVFFAASVPESSHPVTMWIDNLAISDPGTGSMGFLGSAKVTGLLAGQCIELMDKFGEITNRVESTDGTATIGFVGPCFEGTLRVLSRDMTPEGILTKKEIWAGDEFWYTPPTFSTQLARTHTGYADSDQYPILADEQLPPGSTVGGNEDFQFVGASSYQPPLRGVNYHQSPWPNTIEFQDYFCDPDLPGWQQAESGYGQVFVEPNGGVSPGCLELVNDRYGSAWADRTFNDITDRLVVEAWILGRCYHNTNYFLLMQDGIYRVHFGIIPGDEGGYYVAWYDDSIADWHCLMPYIENQWWRIRLDLDIYAGTFDIYIHDNDGAPEHSWTGSQGGRFRGAGPYSIDMLRCQESVWPSGDTAYMLVDDIRVSMIDQTHYHDFVIPDNQYSDMLRADSSYPLVQYVWLDRENRPDELMLEFVDGGYGTPVWDNRAYWGSNVIQRGQDGTTSRKYMGPMPAFSDRWIQLVTSVEDVGIWSSGNWVRGFSYDLHGGSAIWDFTAVLRAATAVTVWGLAGISTVELRVDDGNVVTAPVTLNSYAILNLHGSGYNAFPISGSFEFFDSTGTPVYCSPHYDSIWAADEFTYHATDLGFYPNDIDSSIHDRQIGTFELQEGTGPSMETFVRYNGDGMPIETKASHNGGWIVSTNSYDIYGNLVQTVDPNGLRTFVGYSESYSSAYPTEIRSIGSYEYFEEDATWSYSESGGTKWMSSASGGYSTTQSLSPTKSAFVKFSNPSSSSDDGEAKMAKDFVVGRFWVLSTQFMVTTYSHNKQSTDSMDSGVRLVLYNSGGGILGTYNYWLASWSGTNDYKAPGPNDKSLYSRPSLGVWHSVVVYPGEDWSISWSQVAKIKVELYVKAVDANGDSLEIYFDDFAFDRVKSQTYDLLTGFPSSETDALGGLTSYSYDPLGRVKKIEYPVVNSVRDHVECHYDDTSRTITLCDEKDHYQVMTYDGLGRLVETDRYTGIYPSGQFYSCEKWSYNWMNLAVSSVDANNRVYRVQYDLFGREISKTDPLLHSSSTLYDDASGTTTCYDEYDQVIKVETRDLVGNLFTVNIPSDGSQWLYKHDDAGNLVYVEDPDGRETSRSYDDLNRLVTVNYPDETAESFTYDASGNLLTKTDRNGDTTSYFYEVSGRQSGVVYDGGYRWTMYDAADNVVRLSNSVASIKYSYDAKGRLTSLTEYVDGKALSFTMGYDAANNLISLVYPDTVEIQYVPDDLDRMSDVKWTRSSTPLAHYAYNLDDTVHTINAWNGFLTTYAYDEISRPKSLEITYSGQSKFLEVYSYDWTGNVETIGSTSLDYSSLSQLEFWSGLGGTQYNYDVSGNRYEMIQNGIVTSYSYDPLDNRLTSVGPWTHDYDNNGNLRHKIKSGETWEFGWDGLNQLAEIRKNSVVQAQYYYDGNGARVKTVQGATTTYYVYLGHDAYYQLVDTTATDYVYGGSTLVARMTGAVSHPQNRVIHSYFTDIFGNVRSVYQGPTTKTFEATYDPFGVMLSSSGSDVAGFSGEMKDSIAGLGLYYLFARYYDPSLGRFVSQDPLLGSLADPMTLNLYVYCLNNPLLLSDPTGEGFWSGIQHWWNNLDSGWKTAIVFALLTVAVIVTAGAALGFAAPLVTSMITASLIGGTFSSAVYVGTTLAAGGSLTASGLAASFSFGAFAGAVTAGASPYMCSAARTVGFKTTGLFAKFLKSVVSGGVFSGSSELQTMVEGGTFDASRLAANMLVGSMLSYGTQWSTPRITGGAPKGMDTLKQMTNPWTARFSPSFSKLWKAGFTNIGTKGCYNAQYTILNTGVSMMMYKLAAIPTYQP